VGQECKICRHEKRETIEDAILSGTPYRDIAGRFGTSKTSIGRHRDHLPTTLLKAAAAGEIARADTLLEKVMLLHRRAEEILTRAEGAGLLETALRAIREARSCLELIAKLEGALRDSQVNIVNVDLDPQTAARMAEVFLERRRSQRELTA
jgi:hypothetical protein